MNHAHAERHSAADVAVSAVQGEAVPPSLAEAFRAHASYVAGIAMRLLGRDAEVDDVVQDVFVRAMKGLHQLREPALVRGWLKTVTVRVARNRLRMRRLKALLRLDDVPTYEDIAASGASPEERALLAQVYAILDSLPIDDRLAWTLRHIEGEQLACVADATGCSLATAKRRIASAQAAIERRVKDG